MSLPTIITVFTTHKYTRPLSMKNLLSSFLRRPTHVPFQNHKNQHLDTITTRFSIDSTLTRLVLIDKNSSFLAHFVTEVGVGFWGKLGAYLDRRIKWGFDFFAYSLCEAKSFENRLYFVVLKKRICHPLRVLRF